jgi:hypothetical protein
VRPASFRLPSVRLSSLVLFIVAVAAATLLAVRPAGAAERLELVSFAFNAPSYKDPLLFRNITASFGTPPPGAIGFDHFESGWATDLAAAEPTSLLNRPQVSPKGEYFRIYLGDALPNQTMKAFLRGIYTDGSVGLWVTTTYHTPRKPLVIAIGDSVTAGHHRDAATQPMICHDDTYGYPWYFFRRLQTQLPPAWQGGARYFNLAESGFTTRKVQIGGNDACGTYHTAPLPRAIRLLQGAAQGSGTWAYTVMSVGVNDTNWVKVLGDIAKANIAATLAGGLTEDECATKVQAWNGTSNPDLLPGVSQRLQRITQQLSTADPSMDGTLLTYYNPSGTGIIWATGTPALPATCAKPVEEALDKLNAAIEAGDYGFQLLATDPILSFRIDLLQPFFVRAGQEQGWPHPSRAGAKAVADQIFIY